MSLVESVANVVVGYGVAVVTQILIFPIFGLHTTLAQNLKMGAVFTVVSIARSYVLRRLFEAIRERWPRTASAQAVMMNGVSVHAKRPEHAGLHHRHVDAFHRHRRLLTDEQR
jgi:hypothetical protein